MLSCHWHRTALLCRVPPVESQEGIAVTHINTATTTPCVPVAGRRICWFRCWWSLRTPSEINHPVKQGQACVCRQPAKVGQVLQQEHPLGVMSGCVGECVALVRATEQVCTSNLEELSQAPSCLGISALSCACQSGGTLPIPWSSWCSSNQIPLLDKMPCLCFHNAALKSE